MKLVEARRRARNVLHRIRTGGNPADDIQRQNRTPTLREFSQEYLRHSDPHRKPSGRETVRIYLEDRIRPAFGRMPLDQIGPEGVAARFDAASRGRPGAVNRALGILRAMKYRAKEWGRRERGTNLCLGIRRNPRRIVARFLDTDELARHRRRRHQPGGLEDAPARWRYPAGAIRMRTCSGSMPNSGHRSP